MSVRCKFKVDSITQSANETCSVKLHPVTSGSEENKQFYKWTPTGMIEFSTINLSAAAQFVVGAEYYIDISAATPQ